MRARMPRSTMEVSPNILHHVEEDPCSFLGASVCIVSLHFEESIPSWILPTLLLGQ